MPNESSEIGSGFVKIFYSILITLVICAGIYIIADYLISNYFNASIQQVLSDIMLKISSGISDIPTPTTPATPVIPEG